MKLPAVAIAAAFAGGILLGQSRVLCSGANLREDALIALVAIGSFLILGAVFAWRDLLWLAGSASLLSWLALGVLAGFLTRQPLPPEHILTRLSAAHIPLRTPLRWHGVLRGEPARLPWGYGLEVELTGVEKADGYLPVIGGMRLGFTPRENDPSLPELHAGDAISVLTEARLPLFYRDVGAFNRREFLAQQNIHILATLRASSLLEKTGTTRQAWKTRVARLQGRLRERLDAMFPNSPGTAGILRAMLLGDRNFVDRVESVDFQKTGTFHVLVVAGSHVGALALFLNWLARKLRLRSLAKTLLIIAALFAYVIVVEQRAPVLRAGLTAGIVVAGSFFHRRLDLLNSAAIAGLLLLIAKPQFVSDTGFLLSFLAIGCIAGIGMSFIRRQLHPTFRALEGWRDITQDTRHAPAQDGGAGTIRVGFRATELFVLSVVLQLGMLPLMARDFHRVSLLGPIVNVFAVPLTGVIVPLGFASLAGATAMAGAGRLMGYLLAWVVATQSRIVSFFAAIPHGSYRIPGPPVWAMALFFLGALGIVAALRTQRKLRAWEWVAPGLLLAAMAVVIAAYPFTPAVHAGKLEVTVLDVAQGDSILVVSPRGSTLLIDGGGAFQGFRGREEHLGPDPGEEAVSTYLWSRGFQRLDAVALTHAHQDHIGGLPAVLQNFRVSRLWLGRETGVPAFRNLKQIAARMHVPIENEGRGHSFVWDGVQVDILWPEIESDDISPEAKNNDSLVVRLHYGDRSVLLPGDAEKQVEYAMLAEGTAGFLHADILKIGHHGSKNSTMPEFLATVAPQITIVSSGIDNPYGHPSPELLARLTGSGARVLRTDTVGAVQVLTDGRALQVNCFEKCLLPDAVSGKAEAPDHGEAN